MKTPLYDRHINLGAKIVDFCGWEMPIQYKGIIQEHLAVRNNVGIFDVSHMGRITVEGKDAETFLDYLSTNKICKKPDFSATYTVWPNESGGSVDDVIVYKINSSKFFVIVNACNRNKDLHHLNKFSKPFDVVITDHFANEGILAIQGPKADALFAKIFPDVLPIPFMHFAFVNFDGAEVILSHTGYTGAGGFEIYASHKCITNIWDTFLEDGKDLGIEPIGLGARNTLRLEKGFCLYSHELSDTIAANESVSAWTIKWSNRDFLGKKALENIENSQTKRYQSGIVLQDQNIAREGYEVYKNNHLIGMVTSGTFSPSLDKGIALVMCNEKLIEGEIVDIKIRHNMVKATVVKLPFL